MTDIPIACTLTAAELRDDATELLPGLIASAAARRWTGETLHLEFDATSETLMRIARVVDRERECCRFLDFRIEIPSGLARLRLDVSGPPGSREMLETLLGASARPAR